MLCSDQDLALDSGYNVCYAVNDMISYVRMTVRLPGNKKRHLWADEISEHVFRVLDKYGDRQDEIIIAYHSDIIRKRKAYMSLKYAEMMVYK